VARGYWVETVKLVAGGTLLAGAGDSKFESLHATSGVTLKDDFVGWAVPT